MKNLMIVLGVALVVMLLSFWRVSRLTAPPAATPPPAEQVVEFTPEEVTPVPTPVPVITATFINAKTGAKMVVKFDTAAQTATIVTGAGFSDVAFVPAVSASGARYTNEKLGLELWNKGDEVTLSKGQKVLFTGTAQAVKMADQPADQINKGILVGPTWVWQTTQMNDGKVITPKVADAFTLKFDAKGMASGSTDCNGFSGSYTTGPNNSLTFGQLATTMMFCEGSQEQVFTGMLANTGSYMFTPAGELVLLLKMDSGSVMFTKK